MKPWQRFGLAAVLVFAFWLISWGLITWQLGNPDKPGVFGDMFGAVNALFSGLAFAGIIVALFLQRQDLEMQRDVLNLQMEEIRLQREELARSAVAQEEQVVAVKRQSETLRVTAELNARASLMQAYIHPSETYSKDKWEHHLAQLERVLEELDPEFTP